MKTRKILWEIFLWANWAIIIYFWLQGSGNLLFTNLANTLVALGRFAGLAAGYMILLQFFFMGRLPFLERTFGLDRLSRIHQTNGKLGLIVLLIHPFLLIFGYSMLSGVNPLIQFWAFLTDYPRVWLAFIGLILFLVVIGVSLAIIRSRLRYESWYFVHLLAYLAIFSAFWHQFAVGTDLLSNKIFYGYWVALYIFVFGNHLVFRFLRPIWLFIHHQFFVSRTVRETSNVVSIYISGKNLGNFPVMPGQFMILRFLTKSLWWQAHPFSLSKIPGNKELRISVKELGDFTEQLKNLKPGTKVIVDGPYGVFTNLFGISSRVLMIAGGIGITPIRSLLEEMLAKGKDVVLLYANRTPKDIVFEKELEELEKKYRARIIHVISDDLSWPGEKGRLDEKKLRRLVPDAAGREVYLCGPPPMMEALAKILKSSFSIKSHLLHYERFSF